MSALLHGSMSFPDERMSSNAKNEMVDVYFSADVETDGPIPGPFSILSFAIVFAGTFDGKKFVKATNFKKSFYAELKPISGEFEVEALRVNGLDRDRLCREGEDPKAAMTRASSWVREIAGDRFPVLVAYPLSFDWTWLYWYFVRFSSDQSPFAYSRCFDIKTAYSVKASVPIVRSGRSRILSDLRPNHIHTHHALDDAIEQAELFANIFEWGGPDGKTP